jgi:hypothetical protein
VNYGDAAGRKYTTLRLSSLFSFCFTDRIHVCYFLDWAMVTFVYVWRRLIDTTIGERVVLQGVNAQQNSYHLSSLCFF